MARPKRSPGRRRSASRLGSQSLPSWWAKAVRAARSRLPAANRVLMFEHAIYSVISPEGCASILWRTADKAAEAAEAMKITAQDQQSLGVIDRIVPEPLGGAHRDPDAAIGSLKGAILEELDGCSQTRIQRASRSASGKVSRHRLTCGNAVQSFSVQNRRASLRTQRRLKMRKSLLLLATAVLALAPAGAQQRIRYLDPRDVAEAQREHSDLVQALGGAETGTAGRLRGGGRPPGGSVFGAGQPWSGPPFHASQLGRRECFLGARRLRLCDAPADDADGRQVRAGVRAGARGRPCRRQSCAHSRAICAAEQLRRARFDHWRHLRRGWRLASERAPRWTL